METGFSYRARSTNVGRRRLWIATVVVVVLFLIDLISGGRVRALAHDAVASLSSVVSHMGENIFAGEYFSSHAALTAQVQSLQAQVATLQEQAALSSALEQQVAALSSVAHLAQTAPGITATVVSSFIASPYGTFLIGAGTTQGIVSGDLVLSADADGNDSGVVVGRVSEAGTGVSTVTELFAPDHSVDALVDQAPITVNGVGAGNAKAQVPNGVLVLPGDPVIAPTLGGRIIGVVGHVDSNPSNAAIQLSIGSPVNLSSMRYVFVVHS